MKEGSEKRRMEKQLGTFQIYDKLNVMNFLKTVGSSIHSPKFYSTVSKKTFKNSFGYFFLLALFLSLINIIFLIKPILFDAPVAVSNFATDLINCYPKDLDLNIKNGVATTSAKQPFLVTCKGQTIAVIDTKTPYSPEKFASFSAQAWVTKDSVVYRRSNVENRTYSLAKAKDFKLNKDTLLSFQKKYSPYLKFLGPALLLITFLGIYLSYSFRLIHLLILALLILLLSKSFKKDLDYKSSLKISTYAITLGLIVELILTLTAKWTNFTGFPFMVTILTLAVVFVNLFQSKKES